MTRQMELHPPRTINSNHRLLKTQKNRLQLPRKSSQSKIKNQMTQLLSKRQVHKLKKLCSKNETL